MRPQIEVTVKPESAAEEPTWEVYQPGLVRRRLDRRTRSVLGAAVAAAIVANAGVAWAYLTVTGSRSGAMSGSSVEMVLRARSDLDRPLAAGGTGNLTVTLTNDKDFPIKITSVAPAAGNVVADSEHRDAGCTDASGVRLSRRAFAVSWEVARNTIGAFTIPDGLVRSPVRNPHCDGATYSVPIRAVGIRD